MQLIACMVSQVKLVETPLDKRVKGDHADNCIAIDSDSASSEGIYLIVVCVCIVIYTI